MLELYPNVIILIFGRFSDLYLILRNLVEQVETI